MLELLEQLRINLRAALNLFTNDKQYEQALEDTLQVIQTCRTLTDWDPTERSSHDFLQQGIELYDNLLKNLNEEGDKHLAEKQYYEADYYYNLVLKFDSENIDSWCGVARVQMYMKNKLAAQTTLEKVLEFAPHAAYPLLLLGKIYTSYHRYEMSNYWNTEEDSLKTRRLEKAIEHIQRAVEYFTYSLQTDPEYPSTLLSTGYAYSCIKNIAIIQNNSYTASLMSVGCEECYTKALSIDPTCGAANALHIEFPAKYPVVMHCAGNAPLYTE